jgi:hypothetical protein
VRLTSDEERRAPLLRVVLGELQVSALPRHPDDDVPDAAPAVEPLVQHAQLGLGRRDEREADSGAEKAGACVQFFWSGSLDDVVRPRQQRRRDSEAEGFGSPHVEKPL